MLPSLSASFPTSVSLSPPVEKTPVVTSGSPKQRIQGIDAARAVAILGMVMVHFGPYETPEGFLGELYGVTYGRASILFVTLAGVGMSLLVRAKPVRSVLARVGWRVGVFFVLGLTLQSLGTPVAIILQYYALYFVVGIVVAYLPTVYLVLVAASWMILGPLVYTLTVQSGGGVPGLEPLELISGLLVTGFYPLITWAPPFLVGMAIGRTDLADLTTRLALLGGGTAVAALTYGGSWFALRQLRPAFGSVLQRLLTSTGHSGAPANVLGATAIAVGVLGLFLILVDLAPRLTWPLVATGQLALTIYVGHLFLLAIVPQWFEARADINSAYFKVGRFFLVAIIASSLWRAVLPRGPVETLLRLPFATSLRDVLGPRLLGAGAEQARQGDRDSAPDRAVSSPHLLASAPHSGPRPSPEGTRPAGLPSTPPVLSREVPPDANAMWRS